MTGRKRNDNHRRCDGVRRRDVLHVGGLTALGVNLADWIGIRSASADQPQTKATSCILIWLDGGPSHLETFDLKPDAPKEVRGPFSPIATSVPGISISEHMPETAKMMDKIALVRSMTSTLGEHNFASHYMLTGYKPTPALVYPGMPSVVTHLDDGGAAIPANVALQRPNAMSGPGYLSGNTSPFVVQGDPSKPDFHVQDLTSSSMLPEMRHTRRRRLRDAVDDFSRGFELAASASNPSTSFDQAYDLIASQQARQAFDLEQEPSALRAKYGRHTLGQSCLMARRLIEAGTKFVTVTDRGWDTHEQLYTRLKEGYTGGSVGKIPKLDTAFSALVADLSHRGLLDSTMVIVMGEFGRTPKLNPRGGRDHWPRAFSVALAGGGIRGGQVVGKSDAHGERPAERPVTPADLARTIYNQIGIDPDQELHTADGRPVQINRDGTMIDELVS
tara:strand:- start:51708 stop:53045 length:1338 start_codon:yes stop_codon:yes gene_type:complete